MRAGLKMLRPVSLQSSVSTNREESSLFLIVTGDSQSVPNAKLLFAPQPGNRPKGYCRSFAHPVLTRTSIPKTGPRSLRDPTLRLPPAKRGAVLRLDRLRAGSR